MIKVALYVKLEAKPGKEKDLEAFLHSGLAIVEGEPGTLTWYAIKLSPSTYAIFDTFSDDAGRQAHLSGQVGQALMAKADELLSSPPSIEQVEVLAVKGQS